ncbi:unnamed protein product [Vitrella brassicaformis CCMP3155]|uniref:Uncharacterized protein n=1 Tax=Vitrella brassicaformis (strain CCMP3155) TaxID=1169540 RepID=A0A0G4F3W8_VITBC|nr:unnamed protein product [Vitrella brassicaformis CCMP3155]|eukprot:CEM06615.1 unnamed protein product [Vitrella brassicaformis CCMP3155]
MGNNVPRTSSQQDWPAIRNQSLDVIHREGRDELHKIKAVGNLRISARFLSRVDFEPAVLRRRLRRALHDTQLADGTPLDAVVTFDVDNLESKLLLQAWWLVEGQQWDEAADALRLAHQRTYCELPVIVTQQDLEKHRSKQAYLAEPRVVAQWKMVGRHVNFGGERGGFELFDHGNGDLRAIKDEPEHRLDLTPLPPAHPYHPHTSPHDPPVRNHIVDCYDDGWYTGASVITEASFSSFLRGTILVPTYAGMHLTDKDIDRDARGGVLAGLLDQSVHQPVEGTTAAIAFTTVNDLSHKELLLTPFDHSFIALIGVDDLGGGQVCVRVMTTEPPAAGVSADAPFKQRFPRTTAMARPVLGPIAPIVFDGEDPDEDDNGDGQDDGGDGSDEDMGDDVGDGEPNGSDEEGGAAGDDIVGGGEGHAQ